MNAARKHEAGFSLLEMLIALAIVAILALAQAAPFQRAISSREHAEAAMERANAARLTLQRLAEELTGAVALPDERGRFTVLDRSDEFPASEISFATTQARRMRAGVQDPIELVRYRLEPGPRGSAGGVLMKDQLPSVAAEGTPPATSPILEDVALFTVRVLPETGSELLTAWRGGQDGVAIPRAVELELALADDSDNPPVYRLLIDLPMGGRSRS
ncbi:MAG TPA: prepilin-type N-terminal cleavage/methylation domain-containing protein [Candidatus Binatia bacterium]